MSDSIQDLRSEIAATRARLSSTIDAIDTKVQARTDAVKHTADLASHARENPWLALGLALGAGVAIAAMGADRKAVRAIGSGVRRAPGAAAGAASAGMTMVRERLHRGPDGGTFGMANLAEEPAAQQRTGLVGRLLDGVRDAIDERAAQALRELWDGERELGLPASRR